MNVLLNGARGQKLVMVTSKGEKERRYSTEVKNRDCILKSVSFQLIISSCFLKVNCTALKLVSMHSDSWKE